MSEVREATRKGVKGAAMRLRLIEATIAALTELGYAGASTSEVVRRAKVSRGALLHHFPTRAELLLATARHICEEQERFRRQRLKDVPRGTDRFFSITDAMWATMQRPESVALTELMLGSRADEELREPFAQVMREAASRLYDGPAEVAEDIGYSNARMVRAMAKLHIAAMRGLMVEQHYGGGDQHMDDAYELLVWYKQAAMRRLADPTFDESVRLDLDRPLRPPVVTMQRSGKKQNRQS